MAAVKTWKEIDQGKRAAAPKQTYYSKQALSRALWYLNGLAKDMGSGRLDPCDFQASYDMTQSLNMPIHCKRIGEDSKTKIPLYQCFSYPPLGRNPLKPLGLCKRKTKGGKRT